MDMFYTHYYYSFGIVFDIIIIMFIFDAAVIFLDCVVIKTGIKFSIRVREGTREMSVDYDHFYNSLFGNHMRRI